MTPATIRKGKPVFWAAFTQLLVAAFLFVSAATSAAAHRSDEAYIYIEVVEDTLGGRVELRLEDLPRMFPDLFVAPVTVADFDANADVVAAAVADWLTFTVNDAEAALTMTDHSYFTQEEPLWAQVNFDLGIAGDIPDAMQVRLDPAFAQDPDLRFLVLIGQNDRIGLVENEARHSLMFTSFPAEGDVSLSGSTFAEIFSQFFKLGVSHFLFGYDHVLFLLVLLLPAVLVLQGGHWHVASSPAPIVRRLFVIVTVFAVAHALTFSLAGLGIVKLPVRLVEAAIALTIVWAALANILRRSEGTGALMIFILGLIHGLGFANVLSPYGIEPAQLGVILAAFSLGVEAGQLIFVAAVFPVLYLIRRMGIYVPLVLNGLSAIVMIIGLIWFVERAFEVNVPFSYLLG